MTIRFTHSQSLTVVVIALLIPVAMALADSANRAGANHPVRMPPHIMATTELMQTVQPGAISIVDDRLSAATRLSVMATDTIPSPGIAIGITAYDLQANYALGHQIATNPGSNTVHFLWTMIDQPHTLNFFDRFVNYNSYDKQTGILNQGPTGQTISLSGPARGGFGRIDVGSANECHATFHQISEGGFPYRVFQTYFPLAGNGFHLDYELDYVFSLVGNFYADLAVSQQPPYDGTTDYRHVISIGLKDIGGGSATLNDRIGYWRYNHANPGSWDGPVVIDSVSSILGYTIDAADNSDKVAIAYHTRYITDNLNAMINIAYRESQTAGSGWLNGDELGPAFKNIITSYADTSGRRAWTETSIAYDHNATLHIIYTEQRTPGREHMAIKHWSSERGTIETVTEAYYDNPNFWGRSTNISQISIGIGDGATPCGTGDNTDYLYVMYTKLGGETAEEQADVSQLGYANSELYLTASNDGGINWSEPANLTNTKSPNCTSNNPDSLCASEAWGTLARDVGDIEIVYIRDYESGFFGESDWTINSVMYYNIPGGTQDAQHLCPNIACTCPCHADPQCDGITNVLDVVQSVNVAFRGQPNQSEINCPSSRTDFNCDGITNVLDVVRVVNVAFRNSDPVTEFCDPCL